jgi:hypothetical protein
MELFSNFRAADRYMLCFEILAAVEVTMCRSFRVLSAATVRVCRVVAD